MAFTATFNLKKYNLLFSFLIYFEKRTNSQLEVSEIVLKPKSIALRLLNMLATEEDIPANLF